MSVASKRHVMWIALLLGLLIASGFMIGVQNYRVYAIQTGSMTPVMPSRTAVLVHMNAPVSVGDVISFKTHGELVTHRLIAINADGTYQTKGDANDTPDVFSTNPADVIGPVVASHTDLGFWLFYLKSPTGAGSVLLVFVALFILMGPRENKPTLEPSQ